MLIELDADESVAVKHDFGIVLVRSWRLLAITMLSCIVSLASANSAAQQAFREATHFFEQHQWEQARAAALKAVAADPGMADAEILLGLIATVQSQFNEAEKHFSRAIALEPRNYRAHAYIGSTYMQEKRLSDAAMAFKTVLELNPDNVTANYNLGLIELEEKSPAAALDHFAAALRANRSDVDALTGILTSELMLHRTTAARQTAQQLQALVKDGDPRLLESAALLAQHGEPGAAIPLLERSRRVFPNSWEVNYDLALALFQTGQYDRAAQILDPFTKDQDKAEAWNVLGMIEEKRSHPAEAERCFGRAARREPFNDDYRFDYANALLQHGNVERATAAFRAAIADLPQSWKLRAGLGAASYLSGDYNGAAEALLKAVQLKRDAVAAWYLLGEVYESAPRLQGAIEAAFAAYLATNPHDHWAYLHYGAILYAHASESGGDYRAATACLKQALRLDPNFAEAHFQLGLIALGEGKTRDGISALERAVASEPSLAKAHYRLALAYQSAGNPARAKEELQRFRAIKEDERQRGRVLQSMAAMAR